MDKEQRYKKVIDTAKSALEGYPMDDIGKMATLASILKSEFNEWVFCGFYRVVKKDLLEIGPYQGDVLACGHIAFGRGICGSAAQDQKTIIVDNVADFHGYISCDDQTVSEIVVPVIKNSDLIAVLDIDGDTVGQFDDADQSSLKELVKLI
ncbi:MAG: GAF domain-containing protein [Candidatus Marinimicrobia bacterium]|nr:GAF domain-containing protein [Candidatus Neomarinimicrobiota bacterium]MDP6611915.1 GAF domain-containing protein [Candidatus Neomarinimicrobiota bacterium]